MKVVEQVWHRHPDHADPDTRLRLLTEFVQSLADRDSSLLPAFDLFITAQTKPAEPEQGEQPQ